MIRYQNLLDTLSRDWRPSATLDTLKSRAQMLHLTRHFFDTRGYLEVDTPCLLAAIAPEQQIEPFHLSSSNQTRYLQTSPELAMKRLLANGSGPIYQIAHVFRQEELGNLHNPEFRMLEWYRPHWNYIELMQEVDTYVREMLDGSVVLRDSVYLTYQSAFEIYANVNPLDDALKNLIAAVKGADIDVVSTEVSSRDQWLDLIFALVIQPRLPKNTPVFIQDFPRSQAALAEINPDNPELAQRFELLINGIELANGFQELTNANEQLQRFIAVNEAREKNHQVPLALDLDFIAALKHGMPSCAGVAVGFDRLLMIKLGLEKIQYVMTFPWQNKNSSVI